MRLSDDVENTIRATRARVRLRFPWWLRPFLARGVLAITLGRRVYLAPWTGEGEIETLVRHELVHVRQIARLGVVRFYWRYVREYIAWRRRGFSPSEAYRRISFETEAFASEKPL